MSWHKKGQINHSVSVMVHGSQNECLGSHETYTRKQASAMNKALFQAGFTRTGLDGRDKNSLWTHPDGTKWTSVSYGFCLRRYERIS